MAAFRQNSFSSVISKPLSSCGGLLFHLTDSITVNFNDDYGDDVIDDDDDDDVNDDDDDD